MKKFLEEYWYQPETNLLTNCLLPLSWIFSNTVKARRFLYRHRIIKSQKFSVPVIIVGNITVGGTGKTPFVMWLAEYLQKNGFHPGIVSRGVGGQSQKTPIFVDENSDPKIVGDEAVLLAKKTRCPMAVCVERALAVQALLSKCDVIISDDGLQHYGLSRDIEIALIDGVRELGNKKLLPAGPLRESSARLQEVDFVIRTEPNQFSSEQVVMRLEGNQFVSVVNGESISFENFTTKKIHAVAAIGHPDRFFSHLKKLGLNIIEHVFPDHYLYVKNDFEFGDDLPIIMTEKDAVKCSEFADERFWCLPVKAKMDEKFEKELIEKVFLLNEEYVIPAKAGIS